jgi:hypothetical protein
LRSPRGSLWAIGAFWVGIEVEPVLAQGKGLSLAARLLAGRHF